MKILSYMRLGCKAFVVPYTAQEFFEDAEKMASVKEGESHTKTL